MGKEVLQLVAEGHAKAIARELGISEHTAKFHVGSLLGKLGAASRTEAVTLATRRGNSPGLILLSTPGSPLPAGTSPPQSALRAETMKFNRMERVQERSG